MVEFDVVPLPETDHVAEGDRAPDFTRPLVNDEFWEDTSLSELTDEGPVCLVFYPMDGAFPATYIWNELRDRAFDDLLTVVGVSISTPYAHKRLVAERGMNYDLFADPANGVAEAYGIAHDLDGMAGVSEPRPATFLLDEDRTVQYAWVAEEWPDFPPYDDLEREIRALVD
ncbi:peroxiredoxin [Haloplanus rubicundus]|uniref:thioredoxin-dependent peroxiredoxin n=1 Tax=Haloplanus rubicundus TaxID=1547898 RepID=A0A345DZC7_9EURY|nr:redoxin domain-containing protein [Haloplanus rubicundus]AXG05299.1 peroxiredoxin [Haloplanus rubicundus]AXG08650.1 peroxiredoxin [Haloplanus rubicundus]